MRIARIIAALVGGKCEQILLWVSAFALQLLFNVNYTNDQKSTLTIYRHLWSFNVNYTSLSFASYIGKVVLSIFCSTICMKVDMNSKSGLLSLTEGSNILSRKILFGKPYDHSYILLLLSWILLLTRIIHYTYLT